MSSVVVCLRRVAALSLSLAAAAASAQLPEVDPNLGLMRMDSAGQLVGGHVRALARQPGGRMLVGGDFARTTAGDVRTDLLRLKREGTLDSTFDVSVTSNGATAINAIVVDGDSVYVGGRFEKINGIARSNIAKLTQDGVVVAGWSADLSGPTDVVHAIAVGGGKVYVGGDFSAHDLWGLGRLDAATGAIDAAWRAQTQVFVTPPGGTPSAASRGRVYSLVHTGADLVVGGYFREIAGQARASVARVSLATPATVGAYNGSISSGERNVFALALSRDGGTLYVGGDFFAGSLQRLIRTDAATGVADPNWRPQPNNAVRALELVGPWLYAGGNFSGTTPAAYSRLVRIDAGNAGAIDANWRPSADANVLALTADRGRARLYVGGEFADIAATRRNGLARFGQVVDPDVLFADSYEVDRP
jgi:hypothetical protein